MHARQTIVAVFSTFLRLEDDLPKGWMTDAKLHRSIQRTIADHAKAETSEQFWAVFWHQCWQREQSSDIARIALGHLSAHLQEVCYWSARTLKSRASTIRYSLSDLFQVAISELPKILNACDPKGHASLKTYASSAFGNLIRDFLRQRRDIDLCNEWGLLLKLSRKRLIEVLTADGLDAATIQQYVLAWQCFETLYIPAKTLGLRRSAAPSSELWQAITDRYNQLKSTKHAPGKPNAIERWLLYCTARVRANLYPSVTSLNAAKVGYDSGELQDDIEDRDHESLLSGMIAQEEAEERQDQYQQMNQALNDAIASLDETAQQLLRLYYGQQLTQQQIAKQLEVQQYTVSRKLTKTREILLRKLAQWSEEKLQTSLDSTTIKNISPILDEWLQNYGDRQK